MSKTLRTKNLAVALALVSLVFTLALQSAHFLFHEHHWCSAHSMAEHGHHDDCSAECEASTTPQLVALSETIDACELVEYLWERKRRDFDALAVKSGRIVVAANESAPQLAAAKTAVFRPTKEAQWELAPKASPPGQALI